MVTRKLKRVKKMIDKVAPEVQAMMLSIVLAALRICYDGKETKPIRVIIESFICGFLTLTVFHAIAALGLNMDWAIVSGGVIGFFGTNTVRLLALRFVNKKL